LRLSRSSAKRGSRRSGSCRCGATGSAGCCSAWRVVVRLRSGGGRLPARFDLGACVLDVHADHAGEFACESVHLGAVPDRGHQPGRLPQGVDTSVGPIEVVLRHHVAQHEPGRAGSGARRVRVRPHHPLSAASHKDPDRSAQPPHMSARRSSDPPRRHAGAAFCPAASPVEGEDHLTAELPRGPSGSDAGSGPWSSPNAVPQVATAVGTPERWQAITSV
jgi:hypothetical protein